MRAIAGTLCRKSRALRPILAEWISLNRRAVAWLGGTPWNERAALSLFAAAAWQAGGLALEEFVIDKKVKRRRRKRRYSGRQDLLIRIGSNEFNAESKQCWSRIGPRDTDPRRKINKYLKLACEDVRKAPPYGGKRIAMVFVVPWFPKGKRPKDWKARTRRWLDKVQKLRFDCAAWFLPLSVLDDTAGSVVLIKRVR